MAVLIPLKEFVGADGDPITAAAVGAGNVYLTAGLSVVEYDTQRSISGGSSARIAGTDPAAIQWRPGPHSTARAGWYVYLPAAPPVTTEIAMHRVATTNGFHSQVQVTSGGTFRIRNVTTAVASVIVPSWGWWRFLWDESSTAGSQTLYGWTGTALHDPDRADATITITGAAPTSAMDYFEVGLITDPGATGWDINVDYLAMDSTVDPAPLAVEEGLLKMVRKTSAGTQLLRAYRNVGGAAVPLKLVRKTQGATSGGIGDKLVPLQGGWLGGSFPSKGTSGSTVYDYTAGLQEYFATIPVWPQLQHWYRTNSQNLVNSTDIANMETTGKPRSLGYVTWKPSTTHTWREVADGAVDSRIDTAAAQVAAYPHDIFVGFFHEPEDNVNQTAGSGYTVQDFKDMYRRCVTRFRAAGASNAVFVMNYMGWRTWGSIIPQLYPGDDVVDWIFWDPYVHDLPTTWAGLMNDPSGSWPGFYNWATTEHPGKPLGLGEWGWGGDAQAATSMADEMVAELTNKFPMVKALFYWHESLGVDEQQRLTVTGSPTAGTFTITFLGETTAAIARDATAAAVRDALVALAAVPAGSVLASGGPLMSAPVTLTFINEMGDYNHPLVTISHTFTGGSSPTVVRETVRDGSSAKNYRFDVTLTDDRPISTLVTAYTSVAQNAFFTQNDPGTAP